VEMGSDQEAQAAITAMNGKDMDGRQLTVNEAKPREDRGGGGRGGFGGGRGWSRRAWGRRTPLLTDELSRLCPNPLRGTDAWLCNTVIRLGYRAAVRNGNERRPIFLAAAHPSRSCSWIRSNSPSKASKRS
jgi:hypothetical protein